VDTVSYFVSSIALLLIKVPFQAERTVARRRLRSEILEGLAWLWRQPFLRVTTLLVTFSDVSINALFLAIIIIAKRSGASSALVGGMVALVGVGGFLGAFVAPRLARRLSVRTVVATARWVEAAMVPPLAFVHEPLALGAILGAMMALHPTWDAVVGTYRLRITPDHLQGRTQSAYRLVAVAFVPLGFLVVGFLIEAIGSRATVLSFFGVSLAVAVAATASRAVRSAPDTVALPAEA
jgi:predicted MFS family arabinose efflux permease